MRSRIITQGLRFILVIMLIYGLFEVLYSQAAQLTVPSDVRTESIILEPQGLVPAQAEGRIYYNNTDKRLYYSNGTDWRIFGGPDAAVATRVVSAYNSSGATRDGINPCLGDGTTCNNLKADDTCDGTDDQQEINEAINELPATGGAVYLLEGTYNITGAINFDTTAPDDSGKALIGTGRGTVLKVASGASSLNVIYAYRVNRILISQLMIDGNSKTGSANNGIYFDGLTYSKIDKLCVENMSSYGIYLNNSSSQNTISNNYVAGSGASGIHLDTASSNNTVSYNHIENNVDYCIVFSAWECNYNIASHNDIKTSGQGGIRVGSSKGNIISGNNIQNNLGYVMRHGIDLNSSYYTVVSNNNIEGITYNGIDVYGSSYTTVSNNNVHNNGSNGIEVGGISNNVSGNVIYENGGNGIHLRSLAGFDKGHNIISSNRISDSAGNGYGINIPPDSLDNYLIGNLIDGAGYIGSGYDRRIQDLGTDTKYTDKAKLTFEQAPSQNPLAGGTINATATYIPLNPTTSPGYDIGNITDGKSGGDLLILENINATNYITIPNITANTRLKDGLQKQLSQNKILMLIWDGNGTAGVGDWVEIGDNQ